MYLGTREPSTNWSLCATSQSGISLKSSGSALSISRLRNIPSHHPNQHFIRGHSSAFPTHYYLDFYAHH